jgi:hypothetical protein
MRSWRSTTRTPLPRASLQPLEPVSPAGTFARRAGCGFGERHPLPVLDLPGVFHTARQEERTLDRVLAPYRSSTGRAKQGSSRGLWVSSAPSLGAPGRWDSGSRRGRLRARAHAKIAASRCASSAGAAARGLGCRRRHHRTPCEARRIAVALGKDSHRRGRGLEGSLEEEEEVSERGVGTPGGGRSLDRALTREILSSATRIV